MKKDIFGLHHVGIYVLNREDSIDFYSDVLGFSLDFTTEVVAGNGFLKIAFMRQNGLTVELLELADPSGVKADAERTWNHFGLYVADIVTTVARIKRTVAPSLSRTAYLTSLTSARRTSM